MVVFERHGNTDSFLFFPIVTVRGNEFWNFLFLAVVAFEKINAQHEQGDGSILEKRGNLWVERIREFGIAFIAAQKILHLQISGVEYDLQTRM